MDASTFYGDADIRNHARNRRRVDNATAQRLLMQIADGNASDVGLSDDEEGEPQPHRSVNSQDNEAGPSGLQQPAPAPEENDEAEEARNRKVRTVWTSRDFEPPDTTFDDIHMTLEEVAEPWEYFRRYFPDSLFEEFARCTNIYGLQTSGTNLGTTPEEIKTFFGMMMIMGTLKFSRIRMYWQPATQIPSVSEAMGVNRFFKLRSALHVTETSSPRAPTDKFWKVRPVLDAVRQRCLELAPSENNSIDEQMIPFTGRVAAKQFLRNKPNPEGVKVFVRCSSDGMANDFELYQGKGTGTSLEHKHLGLGGSIVMRLVEHLPKFKNFNWQEYLQDAHENHIQPRKVLDMLGFQNNVGLALTLCNKPSSKKRGRPSLDQTADPPKKVHNAEPRPVNAVRYDGLNHWPAHATQKFAQRCKLEGCTSRTRIRCRKCNVFLCLSATNDCFYAFHHK
ncbi:hypothetical protein HPB47_006164 [Ixodes persulcatus]|uniref:Uncharacterized protein n=1 Tax=Ixodes persulcatus TaxID=34615 RepID=A0AC60PC50_IXOPE|nr:hypothetical protein HPB47_006164 [Ixodes persulcatus]